MHGLAPSVKLLRPDQGLIVAALLRPYEGLKVLIKALVRPQQLNWRTHPCQNPDPKTDEKLLRIIGQFIVCCYPQLSLPSKQAQAAQN